MHVTKGTYLFQLFFRHIDTIIIYLNFINFRGSAIWIYALLNMQHQLPVALESALLQSKTIFKRFTI